MFWRFLLVVLETIHDAHRDGVLEVHGKFISVRSETREGSHWVKSRRPTQKQTGTRLHRRLYRVPFHRDSTAPESTLNTSYIRPCSDHRARGNEYSCKCSPVQNKSAGTKTLQKILHISFIQKHWPRKNSLQLQICISHVFLLSSLSSFIYLFSFLSQNLLISTSSLPLAISISFSFLSLSLLISISLFISVSVSFHLFFSLFSIPVSFHLSLLNDYDNDRSSSWLCLYTQP